MALRLAEVEPRDYQFVITPTGDELPTMIDHWKNVARLLGRPLVPLTGGHSLNGLIKLQNALPNWRMRWCTRKIKIEPFIAYMLTVAPATAYVGLRADETADDRKGAVYGDVDGIERAVPVARMGMGRPPGLGLPGLARRADSRANRLRALFLPDDRRVVCAVARLPGCICPLPNSRSVISGTRSDRQAGTPGRLRWPDYGNGSKPATLPRERISPACSIHAPECVEPAACDGRPAPPMDLQRSALEGAARSCAAPLRLALRGARVHPLRPRSSPRRTAAPWRPAVPGA